MKKKFKEGKFLPGRKRKEQEEDQTEFIKQLIMEIHAPKVAPIDKKYDLRDK
jgi:hypothetical protein